MKLYGKKIFRQAVKRQQQLRTETRDAIVWDVNDGLGNEYFCMVKIQGSNTQIRAKYPMGFRQRPEWLREGEPVIVRHRQGVRGYVEILGPGNTIPTPVAGESSPITVTLPDAIVSGMDVTETGIGGPSMSVAVATGTYRIDGTAYYFTPEDAEYITMDDPAPMTMDDPAPATMGEGEYTVAIDAAPSWGYGRYDILVVGTDGNLDYIAGTPSLLTTEPTAPSIPSGHILVQEIFVYAGMTEITNAHINRKWSYPTASYAQITFSGTRITNQRMTWDTGDDTPQCDIDIQVYNQYDAYQSFSVGGITATLTMAIGTGTGIYDPVTETWTDVATLQNFDGSETVIYERDQTISPEISPMFQLAIEGYPAINTVKILTLLDSGGDPI